MVEVETSDTGVGAIPAQDGRIHPAPSFLNASLLLSGITPWTFESF